MRMHVLAGVTVALVLAAPGAADAQVSALTDKCATITTDDARRFCNLVGNAILAVQPPVGLAAGANPVPGTASTLGMRLGSTPRISVSGRVGLVRAEPPPILDRTQIEGDAFVLPSLSTDVAVGLYRGMSPAPTIGGFLSLDGLARVGLLFPPAGAGFDGGMNLTWGVGLRLGLLRESFSMPGVSVSAMVHDLGELTFGDPALVDSDAFFQSDVRAWSLRAGVSKRVYLLGLTAGVGIDRYVSNTLFGLDAGGFRTFVVDGLELDRNTAFLNAQWTMLVLHFVAEVGWQEGAGEYPALLPGGDVEGGALFGGVAVRLSI